MAATADRSRFTTEKVDIDHDCQAIAANSQGLIGKSSNFSLFVTFLFYVGYRRLLHEAGG